jgi:hypothetical protein
VSSTVSIPARFCGPPTSANGGYCSGLLAEFLGGPAEITLRAPPPLDEPLTLIECEDGAQLRSGDTLIAEGRRVDFELALPEAVDFESAVRASTHFVGHVQHPYPRCFVCGPDRESGDGLGLFPGKLVGRDLVAAPFRPDPTLCDTDGQLSPRMVWAALDCPSWWGYAACVDTPTQAVLLGRLAAHVRSRPQSRERCVVLGWALGREGRRVMCASALFGEDGTPHAYARATWIELKSG